MVWRSLRRIPYGQTRSYQALARRIGHPNSFRAVGGACGKNPIAVFIPCHRVINADGKLGGFTGGLRIKRQLLALEQKK
jgi:methylated-DNA-[protein]-cysteine S-methyltransferase